MEWEMGDSCSLHLKRRSTRDNVKFYGASKVWDFSNADPGFKPSKQTCLMLSILLGHVFGQHFFYR